MTSVSCGLTTNSERNAFEFQCFARCGVLLTGLDAVRNQVYFGDWELESQFGTCQSPNTGPGSQKLPAAAGSEKSYSDVRCLCGCLQVRSISGDMRHIFSWLYQRTTRHFHRKRSPHTNEASLRSGIQPATLAKLQAFFAGI